jgi:NAD(P) transhydrogenase subunit alpha
VPGKAAPVLITEEMVNMMRHGSVIVDLGAEQGGNCALTRPGEVVVRNGVTIVGYVDLPSRLAPTASQLYGSNLTHLLADMGGAKSWHVDLEDGVVRGALVLLNGELMWPPPKPAAPPPKPAPRLPTPLPAAPAAATKGGHGKAVSGGGSVMSLVAIMAVLLLAGQFAPKEFVAHLTVFVLACFVGYQVIWNVTPALHTPLMSVTNAISGIIVVGGMLQLTSSLDSPVTMLGAIAVLVATINVAGGFLVTQRMLKMFRR